MTPQAFIRAANEGAAMHAIARGHSSHLKQTQYTPQCRIAARRTVGRAEWQEARYQGTDCRNSRAWCRPEIHTQREEISDDRFDIFTGLLGPAAHRRCRLDRIS